jgi:hypothetical protein
MCFKKSVTTSVPPRRIRNIRVPKQVQRPKLRTETSDSVLLYQRNPQKKIRVARCKNYLKKAIKKTDSFLNRF